jgi:uncharacterized membrane protein
MADDSRDSTSGDQLRSVDGAEASSPQDAKDQIEASDADKSTVRPLSRIDEESIPYMENLRPQLHQRMIAAQEKSWSGPLPPPEAAERYERLCPGSLNRLLTMMEKERDSNAALSHRQLDLVAQQQVLAENGQKYLARDTKLGLWMGFFVACLAVGGAVICAKLGEKLIASLLLSVPLMSVATAFIKGSSSWISDKSSGKADDSSKDVSAEVHGPRTESSEQSKA